MSQTVKLVLIPQISTEDFPLCLPTPTALNCGGYILPSATGTVYAYSPIDLAVAAIEAKSRDLIVSDLDRFFYANKKMSSVFKVYLGILIDDNLCINHVEYWRVQCYYNNGLSAILHKNAPLTFGVTNGY